MGKSQIFDLAAILTLNDLYYILGPGGSLGYLGGAYVRYQN